MEPFATITNYYRKELHLRGRIIWWMEKLLRLLETYNALQLPVFFSFFSFFCQPYPEYRGIRSKKYFTDHWTANTIQLFVPIKRKFLGWLYRLVLPATLTYSQPLSPTLNHSQLLSPTLNHSHSLPPIFQQKQPIPTHFSTKATHSHPFFNKNNPLPQFSRKVTHSHPVFQETQPTPTHFLTKTTHSRAFFKPLPPIFWQKRHTPTLISILTTHSHPFFKKKTHSYPFFDKSDTPLPIFQQKRSTATHFWTKRPIPWFFNKTSHSHPRLYWIALPATLTHSQWLLLSLIWRAFLLIQLISGH